MNIKNKILLTLIAIIFAICLFNTNCFAFEVSNDYLGTVNLPDEINDYYFIFTCFDQSRNGNIDWYALFVATEPIYHTHYRKDGYTVDSFGFYTDGIILKDILLFDNDIDKVQETLNSVTLNYSSTKTGTFFNSTTYDFLNKDNIFFCNNNFDIVDLDSGDILVPSNVNKSERGTSDNTGTDNGETGNETIGGDSENTTDSDDSGGILSSIKEGFENVVNFFKELIEGITNIFKTIGDNFLDLFTKLGEWFSDLFEKLGNWFSSLGSSIGGFFSDLWDNIKSFFSGVVEFFANFWELIEDFFIRIFRYLFVPNQNSFTGIIDIVKSKFDFIETIKISANSLKDLISNVGTAPKLTININDNEFGIKKLTIIDLEWYKPYKTYGDLILTGFIYAFFLWRLFITIPNIIKGQAGTVSDVVKITDNGGKI